MSLIPPAIINERIKPTLLRILGKTPEAATRALQSPLLTVDTGETKIAPFTTEEAAACDLIAEDGAIRTPFQEFRFCMKAANGDAAFGYVQRNPRMTFIFLHRWSDGRTSRFICVAESQGQSGNGSVLFSTRVFITDTMEEITEDIFSPPKSEVEKASDAASQEKEKEVRDSTISRLNEELKSAKGDRNKELQKAKELRHELLSQANALERQCSALKRKLGPMEDIKRSHAGNEDVSSGVQIPVDEATRCSTYYQMLANLCYQYLAPFNFVARVAPRNSAGRSVEWIKSREHYTIVHRHHPANSAAVESGSCVAVDGRHLQRLAHSRRAHTKLLTHERYKFKRGKRVFVRASWVGPKEWKDTAGQIYQVLTPV